MHRARECMLDVFAKDDYTAAQATLTKLHSGALELDYASERLRRFFERFEGEAEQKLRN